jgi:hypothetical protein
MAAGLPEEGDLRLGSVTLRRGKLINAHCSEGDPVAWATVDPVLERGRVWAAYPASAQHPQPDPRPTLSHGPAMCLPVPGRHGSGRRLAGSLIPDRTPWSAIGSSSKRGMTCR